MTSTPQSEREGISGQTDDVISPSLAAARHGGTFVSFFSEFSEVPTLAEAFLSPEPSDIGDDGDDEEIEWHDFDIDFGGLFLPEVRKTALVALRERLRAQLTPRRVLLVDKITFVLGTMDLFVSAYWLGFSPQTFYKLYSFKTVFLLLLRWIYYRSTRQHYYFFDLCYFVQILLLLQLHVFPRNIPLAKVTFAFSVGPLLWSIVAFRNSLVYHSLDKVTSLFLHWFPAIVCYTYRFHTPPEMETTLSSDPALRARWETATPWELCFLPMVPYGIWAILYYLKIFVISSDKISTRGYETLFTWLTSRKTGLFALVILKFPRQLQPVVYLGLHMALTQTAMAFNVLWWSSRSACSVIILAAFAMAAWNGANFYFEVFVHRYLAGLGIEPRRQPSRSPAPPAAAPVAAAAAKNE